MSLTLEEVKTIYFDPNAIRLPDYKMGRVQFGDGRLYYRYGYKEKESVELFSSLTTVIYQCCPMPHSLLEWYVKLGMVEAKRFSMTAAHYGTMMHIAIGRYCENQEYDFDKTDQEVENYLSRNDFWQPECKDWKWRLKEDMLAWITFAYTTKMKPIAVEMVLCSSKGYATAIDVVAEIDVAVRGDYGEVYKSGERKGERKLTVQNVRKTVLINMKSGRHGFYENNGLQCEAERILFEENFPDIKIDATMNWAPTDWKSVDGDKYKTKDWSGLVDPREIDCMFKLAEVKFRDKMEQKERVSIYGQHLFGNDPRSNVSVSLLTDMIRNMEIKKTNPEVAYDRVELDISE